MADAWGEVNDDDYEDSNPFGSDNSNYNNNGYNDPMGQQDQQQDLSTDDYLSQAVSNLIETEELGEEGLAHLAAQREVLDNIRNNVSRMDNTLDAADRTITEMENPWAIGPVATKSSGNRNATTGNVGAAGYTAGDGGASFQMEGDVMKRARIFKNWNKRYFRQTGDAIEYFYSKTDSKLRGRFVLKGATLNRIAYGEKDSNGATCNKDNCFEIILAGQSKGDTIHIESNQDYNTWLSCIERQINPERYKSKAVYDQNGYQTNGGSGPSRSGVGFGNQKQDAMLDTIIDKLDNIDGISRLMGAEVDDQTKIIEDLTSDMDRLDNRVEKNKDRVQKIK